MKTPFERKMIILKKEMQILKLKNAVYNYLKELGDVREDDCYSIPEYKDELKAYQGFDETDMNTVNPKIQEIINLEESIYSLKTGR